MKKIYIIFTSLLLVSALSFPVMAEEENKGPGAPFGIDLGIGLSAALFNSETLFYENLSADKATRENLAGISTLYTFRINGYIDFRFSFLGILHFGFETGLSWLAYESINNGINYSGTTSWFDIPFRGFIRVGIPIIYFQAMGGYYLGLTPIWNYNTGPVYERGPEVGGRLNIFAFYIEAFYIFTNVNPHIRLGLGLTVKIL